MREYIYLAVGLAVGAIGISMFKQSLPPPEGSTEEKVVMQEHEMERMRIKIAALEATDAVVAERAKAQAASGARNILSDLKDGKLVDMNDVFKSAKPFLRDFGPIFDRLHLKDQKAQFARLADEMTGKYHLSKPQQEALKKWLEDKAIADTKKFREFMLKDSTGMEDMAKASRDIRPREGLDEFMRSTLNGENLTKYNKDRMTERAASVQNEAEVKVARMNDLVSLDDSQQDKVFAIMARGSKDFDPSMQLEGLSGDTSSLGQRESRDDAIMNVLRPDQRQQYEEVRARRRAEEETRLNEVGLKLPANWDVFEDRM